jgi:KDO2-lipid IV(A) lauroyltransferase
VFNVAEQIQALRVSFTGRLIYWLLPYRRKVILTNINRVYGEKLTLSEKKQLTKAFYSHIATSIKEAFQLRFMSKDALQAKVEVKGHEHMLNIVAQQKGVLVLTGHFGNWEFAPLGGILNFKQFQGHFHFIRRTLGFKRLEQILFKRYYEAGLHVIPKKNSLQMVSDALDKNHAVVFVMDQHARVSNRDGIPVEFFGEKAGTYRSLATFARHTNIPVVPAASYRLPNGQHVLEFYEPIMWEECNSNHESLYTNTLKYNQALEKIILAHPEQWIWLHKRWKLTT